MIQTALAAGEKTAFAGNVDLWQRSENQALASKFQAIFRDKFPEIASTDLSAADKEFYKLKPMPTGEKAALQKAIDEWRKQKNK